MIQMILPFMSRNYFRNAKTFIIVKKQPSMRLTHQKKCLAAFTQCIPVTYVSRLFQIVSVMDKVTFLQCLRNAQR